MFIKAIKLYWKQLIHNAELCLKRSFHPKTFPKLSSYIHPHVVPNMFEHRYFKECQFQFPLTSTSMDKKDKWKSKGTKTLLKISSFEIWRKKESHSGLERHEGKKTPPKNDISFLDYPFTICNLSFDLLVSHTAKIKSQVWLKRRQQIKIF